MNLISGVVKEDYSDYVLYFVEKLSDELKQEIRNRLVVVCYGADQAQSSLKIYSYKETVKEFVKRYLMQFSSSIVTSSSVITTFFGVGEASMKLVTSYNLRFLYSCALPSFQFCTGL